MTSDQVAPDIAKDFTVQFANDLTWVEQVQTVDAIDFIAVEAINENPGWRLIGVGVGAGGQTTLTYGWPWPAQR